MDVLSTVQKVFESESRMPGVPCKPSVDCQFAEWLAGTPKHGEM